MCARACTAPRPAVSGWISMKRPSPIPSRRPVIPRALSANGTMVCSIRITQMGEGLRSFTAFAQDTGAITSARHWNTTGKLCRARAFASMILPTRRWLLWNAVTRRVNRSSPISRIIRRTRPCRCRTGGGTSLRTKKSSCATVIRAAKICRTCAARWPCARTLTGTSGGCSRSLINSA